MAYNFRPVNRDQLYLLPPSLRDWLPEDHLAWFLIDAVEQMNLRAFYEKYRVDGWGGESYDPTMMVTLLLYAYCVGERSSRRIERLCLEDVAFRVITANQKPDHVTWPRCSPRCCGCAVRRGWGRSAWWHWTGRKSRPTPRWRPTERMM